MENDWIITVLDDLRRFAQQNEMYLLEAQIDDAMLAAQVELAARPISAAGKDATAQLAHRRPSAD